MSSEPADVASGDRTASNAPAASPTTPAPEALPLLTALGGRPAPSELASHLAELGQLPAAARNEFGDFLALHLQREVPEELATVAQRFAKAFDIPLDRLSRVVSACRLLIRNAALRDVSVDQLIVDLNMLCGEHTHTVQLLSSWYHQALPKLRSLESLASLDDFGAVLEDVRVRKSYLPSSRHTPQVVTPIYDLTLCYREDGQRKRVTVQLDSKMAQLLRAKMADAT